MTCSVFSLICCFYQALKTFSLLCMSPWSVPLPTDTHTHKQILRMEPSAGSKKTVWGNLRQKAKPLIHYVRGNSQRHIRSQVRPERALDHRTSSSVPSSPSQPARLPAASSPSTPVNQPVLETRGGAQCSESPAGPTNLSDWIPQDLVDGGVDEEQDFLDAVDEMELLPENSTEVQYELVISVFIKCYAKGILLCNILHVTTIAFTCSSRNVGFWKLGATWCIWSLCLHNHVQVSFTTLSYTLQICMSVQVLQGWITFWISHTVSRLEILVHVLQSSLRLTFYYYLMYLSSDKS